MWLVYQAVSLVTWVNLPLLRACLRVKSAHVGSINQLLARVVVLTVLREVSPQLQERVLVHDAIQVAPQGLAPVYVHNVRQEVIPPLRVHLLVLVAQLDPILVVVQLLARSVMRERILLAHRRAPARNVV